MKKYRRHYTKLVVYIAYCFTFILDVLISITVKEESYKELRRKSNHYYKMYFMELDNKNTIK